MIVHLKDDLFYTGNYSSLLDFQVLWMMIGALLRRKSAHGVQGENADAAANL